jgi:broad specificity phosphatase PhoE
MSHVNVISNTLIDIERALSFINDQQVDNTSIVIRHAEKSKVYPTDSPWLAPISEDGAMNAKHIGTRLRMSGLTKLRIECSPLLRCTQTAQMICDGLETKTQPVARSILGNPGPYVTEGMDIELFATMSSYDLIKAQSEGRSIKGLRSLDEGTKALLSELIRPHNKGEDVLVAISHDVIIAGALACLTGADFGPDRWIGHLDGFMIFEDKDGWHVFFEGKDINIDEKMRSLGIGL